MEKNGVTVIQTMRDKCFQNIQVSIIIPVYQVETFIENCLQSVMGQSYQGKIECLLVDDCGKDNSIALAERKIANYKGAVRFEILHHERNRGLSAARNTGLDAAIGDYEYFLDSDDTITVDCIERLMSEVESHPDVEMVQGNLQTTPVKTVDSLTVRVKQPVATTNDEVRRCFFEIRQMNVAAWNKLIKRSFLMEHSVRFWEGVIFEDAPWTFMLLKYLERACFVKEITYHYILRKNSIMTGSNRKAITESLIHNYRNILTNLTPGRECEEIAYFGTKMAYFCARYSRIEPTFREYTMEWQEMARRYAGLGVRARLAFGQMISQTRYGWLLLSLLYRFENPRIIPSDIKRVWIKTCKN